MNWDEVSEILSEKLDAKNIKPPKQFGPKGDYIEGWHAVAEANRAFGFGGWSYTIIGLTKDFVEEGDGKARWVAGYTCIVEVTVGDVKRQDVGFGSGYSNQKGDAIEGAIKEATTDALKRALRTFGNIFGLALYDKSRANVGVNEQAASSDRDRIKPMVEQAGDLEALQRVWKGEWSAIQALPEPMKNELIAAKDARKEYLAQKEAA